MANYNENLNNLISRYVGVSIWNLAYQTEKGLEDIRQDIIDILPYQEAIDILEETDKELLSVAEAVGVGELMNNPASRDSIYNTILKLCYVA